MQLEVISAFAETYLVYYILHLFWRMKPKNVNCLGVK